MRMKVILSFPSNRKNLSGGTIALIVGLFVSVWSLKIIDSQTLRHPIHFIPSLATEEKTRGETLSVELTLTLILTLTLTQVIWLYLHTYAEPRKPVHLKHFRFGSNRRAICILWGKNLNISSVQNEVSPYFCLGSRPESGLRGTQESKKGADIDFHAFDQLGLFLEWSYFGIEVKWE